MLITPLVGIYAADRAMFCSRLQIKQGTKGVDPSPQVKIHRMVDPERNQARPSTSPSCEDSTNLPTT